MALDHSLTHSLTHSILINLFITVGLNTLLLPPLLSITFVPSAFYLYVWHILEGTSNLLRYTFFPDTSLSSQPSRRWVCGNGNILKNTDNIIGKKWTWSC